MRNEEGGVDEGLTPRPLQRERELSDIAGVRYVFIRTKIYVCGDDCSPLSLGEGWGEASLYAISVSAPPMSSSARSMVEGPAESFAKS